MAYVGTPTNQGSAINTLASILQGEAGNQGPLGMQAVANVVENRVASNYGNYGSDWLSQMLAPNQFQGQSAPSAQAVQIATAAVNGQLSDVTSGATQYANPQASTASWATRLNNSNSLQIGQHYFTNNTTGAPFTGAGQVIDPTQPLQYNTGTDPTYSYGYTGGPNSIPSYGNGSVSDGMSNTDYMINTDPQGGAVSFTQAYPTGGLDNNPYSIGTGIETYGNSGVYTQNPFLASSISASAYPTVVSDNQANGFANLYGFDTNPSDTGNLSATGGTLLGASTGSSNNQYTIGDIGTLDSGGNVSPAASLPSYAQFTPPGQDMGGSSALTTGTGYQVGSNAFGNPNAAATQSYASDDNLGFSNVDTGLASGSSPTGSATNIGATNLPDAITSSDTPATADTSTPNAQDLPTAVNKQTAGNAKDFNALTQTISKASQTQAQTSTSITSNVESWFSNIFVRFGAILLGIVMIGAGIFLFRPVQDTIKTAAKIIA